MRPDRLWVVYKLSQHVKPNKLPLPCLKAALGELSLPAAHDRRAQGRRGWKSLVNGLRSYGNLKAKLTTRGSILPVKRRLKGVTPQSKQLKEAVVKAGKSISKEEGKSLLVSVIASKGFATIY